MPLRVSHSRAVFLDNRLRELTTVVDSGSSDDEFAIYTNRKRIFDDADPCQIWGGAASLVGKTVRVYWPVEGQWYDGLVGAWDPKRQKHKYVPTSQSLFGDMPTHLLWQTYLNPEFSIPTRTRNGYRLYITSTGSKFGVS